MAFTKKIILFSIFLSLCLCFCYSQAKEQCFITDSGVRLRDEPSLNGKIIRVLDKNEQVGYIAAQDLHDGSDYKWINITTSKETGWVFGEFVSKNQTSEELFSYIEDVGLKTPTKVLYSGMNEKILIKTLGEPLTRIFDAEYNEDTLTYGADKDLIFLVHKYNQRIHHVIVKSKNYILANNVKVGMNIFVIKSRNLHKINDTLYTCELQNLFKSSFFDTSVNITVDSKGIITEIQIGLPE